MIKPACFVLLACADAVACGCRYSTGEKIDFLSSCIHQAYGAHTEQPVLLTVDTALTNMRMGVKVCAFSDSCPVSLADHHTWHAGLHWQDAQGRRQARRGPLPARDPGASNPCSWLLFARCLTKRIASFQEYAASEAERIGVDALINGHPDDKKLDAPATVLSGRALRCCTLFSPALGGWTSADVENLELSMEKLQAMIETVQTYVNKVVVRSWCLGARCALVADRAFMLSA